MPVSMTHGRPFIDIREWNYHNYRTSHENELMAENPFRELPQVSRVLEESALAQARLRHPQEALTAAVRAELDLIRARIRAGHAVGGAAVEAIAARAASRLESLTIPTLRTVINATGIVLHTNLGRSPMIEAAAQAAYQAASSYLNLELSLETGERSIRQDPIREGVRHLTGAESATAVNNCAAATVIVLRALAAGKEVIVSRGQLIEIGGSFRIPEIMAVSGANLREVGTTNITRIADYEKAIGPSTGLLMRIHTSNFRVRGFTQAASINELVALGRKHNIPVVDDVGSGMAIDLAPYGLPGEPLINESIRAGADLILFSGDKLLGGPQAGIIAGREEFIHKIEKDPLMRAFRLDKMTLAALEATLLAYRDPARALQTVPIFRMLTMPVEVLRERCQRFAARLQELPGLRLVSVESDHAFVGGGSLPDVALPTVVIDLEPTSGGEEQLARQLRTGTPAVVGRIHNGRLRLDLRTVFEGQEDDLFAAIRNAAVATPSMETPLS